MGTAVVAKDFSTKISKVQVTDEATARQWFAETRVNLDDDPDVVSQITFQARQIMIAYLPAEEYNNWYERCESWTLGHDDNDSWTDHDAATGISELLCDINDKFGVGDITNNQIEEIVTDAAASMPGLSEVVTKNDWKSFYGHYLSLDKRDFKDFSGQTIVDLLSYLYNKITKIEDVEEKKFEKANEAAASHKSIHEIGNDLWYFFHHDSSLDDDEYEPDDEPEEKEEDQKKKDKLERRAKIQEIISDLYDLQTNANNVISVILDDRKRGDVKKVKVSVAESKKDKAEVVAEDTGTTEPADPKVIDAEVLDEKVIENPPAVQPTIDLGKLMPAPIPEDQYHDLMDQVQKAQPYVPWHVTRAAVSALLNCIGKLSLESIFAEIKTKNDQTGQEWYPVYSEIINAITSKFSPLGPIVPGVKAEELSDVISKDALLNVAVYLDNQLGGDEQLEKIIEQIRRYTPQVVESADSDIAKNPFVYVNGSATTSSVLSESVRKQVLKAFGDLLNNRTYELESIGNGNIIQLSFPDRQQAYWIDPSIIIGDGFNLYWQADSPIMINISRNRDIIKKILDDPNYALTPEEYNRVRAGQFANDGLYDCLDMSGMSRAINGMNADTMHRFEEKLNKIFGINPQTGAFANPVFQSYGKLFRFRFSKFKDVDNFTLVSDEKVKSPVQGVNDVLLGMTVLVYKNNYIVKYNEQSFQIDF